jgi:hypothetical protein
LCAVQTWNEGLVISVHRAGFLPTGQAPQNQINAAAGQCTNFASIDGWMPAEKKSNEWVGQARVCAFPVQPGLEYVIHVGAIGHARAFDMCIAASGDARNIASWY